MEVKFFSARPRTQNLTLIPCNTSFSWLNPSSLRSIRRDFIRPPAVGRKSKKLALFHTHSAPFLVKASVGSNSNSVLLVAAIVTFSAISAAYFNRLLKSKKSSKEGSRATVYAISQLGSNAVNQIIDGQNVDSRDVEQGFSKEDGSLKESEINLASEDERAHPLIQKATVEHNEALSTVTLESFGAEPLDARTSTCISLKESETISVPFALHMPPESDVVQPCTVAKKASQLQSEKDLEKTELYPELPGLTVRSRYNSSPHFKVADDAQTEVNNEGKSHTELDEESKTTSLGSILTEIIKSEQYTLNEANQAVARFPVNMNALKAISSQASPLSSYSLLSRKMDNEVKVAALSAQDSIKTAEYVEEAVPVTNHKGGSSDKSKYVKRDRGSQRVKEREPAMQDDYKKVLQLPNSHSTHPHASNSLSDPYTAYNRLIRNGRLTDCINLLKDMESRGLLDMNKVYHARFFKVCNSQKAVKEAFEFMNLISNPTLSTFNMLMSVCANSQDSEGAFQVLRLVKEVGLKADCKLYTNLISTCAKSGKVDAMFGVFHEMVNAGIEPNVHTYGALIDGCAKAGQVAKAFGAYGIMRSKNVKPDRVVFNALISACGQSGAVDRAFDVLSEMSAETQPIDPDHVTIGALIKACANAGQVDRANEVYKMMDKYDIKGTPEVYTIAANCCSQTGDWQFACSMYDDMTRKGVVPDEIFLSALIDVAGHAGKVEAAFEILQDAKSRGIQIGTVVYSSLMGACSNAKNWQKALELYENIKSIKLKPTVSTMNALITALCDGDQLLKAVDILSEMKSFGFRPNTITYSVLLVASERKDDIEVGLKLLYQAKEDGIVRNLTMFKCIIGMCLRRYGKARTLGEKVLSSKSGRPHIENKWTSLALSVYREAIIARITLTMEVVSQVLGCLQLPHDVELKGKLIENLGVNTNSSRFSNLCSLIDGFGEYDPRAFSLLEEAASLGIVPFASFKESPVVVDVRKLQTHIAEVYLLTVLKGLKHRLAAVRSTVFEKERYSLMECMDAFDRSRTHWGLICTYSIICYLLRYLFPSSVFFFFFLFFFFFFSIQMISSMITTYSSIQLMRSQNDFSYFLPSILTGAKLPNINILLPVEKTRITSMEKEKEKEKTINLAERVSQSVAALLRRLGLPYQGSESYGKIRINGLALKRWYQPNLASPLREKPGAVSSFQLGKGISFQQRDIRTGNLSLD